MRDHRRHVRDHRLQPGPPCPGRAGGAHRRRGARFPGPQLPARVELHGRLRIEPARPADGLHRGGGGGQDGGRGVLRAAADPAGGAVPGHHLCGAQAAEVQAADLPARQRALPPPHGPHRLLEPAYDRLPVRLDADAGRPGAGAAIHPLQRPQRPPEHGLDAGRGGPRAGGGGRQRVPGVRARDPQVPPPGRDPPAPPAPGCLTRRDRARCGQGPGDGRDRRGVAARARRRARSACRPSRAA